MIGNISGVSEEPRATEYNLEPSDAGYRQTGDCREYDGNDMEGVTWGKMGGYGLATQAQERKYDGGVMDCPYETFNGGCRQRGCEW